MKILSCFLDDSANKLTLFILFISFELSALHAQVVSDSAGQSDSRQRQYEFVNIGYGSVRRNEIIDAVTLLKTGDFNKGNINSPVQLIQGRVAGLAVSKPGSNPNEDYYLRLRGLSSINENTQPLVVINGVNDVSMFNLDPADIESITILKSIPATAIYGIRGSGGAILITTKKGSPGKSVIEYSAYSTAEMPSHNIPMMTSSEWRALSVETGLGTDFRANTNWFNQIERTALSQVHNISMSGGSDKTSYRASFNYRQGEGVLITTGYEQYNGRLNLTQKALSDKLTLDLNLSATERKSEYGFNDAFRYAAISNPTSPVTSDDPAYKMYDGYFQQILFDYYNPVSILKENINEGKNRILNISLKGTYEILKGLTLDALYSSQVSGSLGGQYFNTHDYWGGINRNGLASRQEDNSSNKLFESTLHYSRERNALSVNVIGGYSFQDFVNEGFAARGGNFLTDNFSFNNLSAALDFKNGKGTLSSYKNSNRLVGFFGRISLDLNKILFLNASSRYEGSSRFGMNNKWNLFHSISGGLDLAKAFNMRHIDLFMLRAGFGVTGNQPMESYLSLLQLGPSIGYLNNSKWLPTYNPVSNPNPDLRSEIKREFDAGLDFSIIDSRLTGSFDLYSGSTSGLLYSSYYAVEGNYAVTWLNLGKIKNSGMELTLNFNVVKRHDFSYNITLSQSFNLKNTLVSLSGSFNGVEINNKELYLSFLGSPGGDYPIVEAAEGEPIGQIIAYGFLGVDSNGQPILEDVNKDGFISYNDLKVAGNGLPKLLFGLGNSFSYKHWDLDIFFRGVTGHSLLNSFRAIYEYPQMIYSYNLLKTAADMKNPATGKLMSWGRYTDRDVENASFISLDNLSLGYSFSLPSTSPFSSLKIFIAANRLFYLTKYKGIDPEPRYSDVGSNIYEYSGSTLVPGIERRSTWCRTRSVTFGLDVAF